MSALAQLLILLLLQHVLSATRDDITGVFSLSKNESPTGQKCPQVIRYRDFETSGPSKGYIRIPHNRISIGAAARCARREPFNYTAMLDADELEKEMKRNSHIFKISSNADRGLLKALLDIRSIIGVELHGNLRCDNIMFRKGTIYAIVRNDTKAAPKLGLDHLLDGATYLLIFETEPDAKRCVYRSETKVKRKAPIDCFPAHASVAIGDAHVRMDQLSHGALIRTGVSHSRVFAFSHRDKTSTKHFMRFTTRSGARLTISSGHYVYSHGKMRAARTIRVGDVLDTAKGHERVHRVEPSVLARGVYNPHTESGTMLVGDGEARFHVSCYTESVHPHLAKILLTPVRLAWRLTGGWRASHSPLRILHKESRLRIAARWLPRGPAHM